MLELIINNDRKIKKIELVEDCELIEIYEEEKEVERNEGNIYIGVVKDIIAGMQSAFIDIGTNKNGFIHLKDILPKTDEVKLNSKKDLVIKEDIREILKQNQKVLVQVKKDSNDRKGAKVSTHISIPSKYIVLMPNADIITVSQKIEDKVECKRLIELVKNNISKDNGAVVRTSAIGKTQEIIEDIKKQEKKWEDIKRKHKKEIENIEDKQTKLIYKNESIIEKLLIDLSDKDIKRVIVTDKEDYKQIEDLIRNNKELKNIKIEVKSIEDIQNIYDMERQIEKSKLRKIWLKSGGFITIDKTEALTAIDVNTGKYTGSNNLEETVYKVNEEATIEISKQLRLRDIGGIIIIDYIDMKDNKNKEKIEKLLREKLKDDRTKTQIEGFTKLDLMELTRKHICSHKE